MGKKFTFGVGVLNAKQTRDNRGRLIAEADREYIGIDRVKGLTFETSAETKTLYGSRNYPEASAVGQKSISGSITLYGDDLRFRALIEGETLKTGSTLYHWKYNTFTIPQGGSYTLVPDDNGTFIEVINVLEESTAKKFKKVASNPKVGEFAVSSAGVFTFNVADEDKEIYINYKYKTDLGYKLLVRNMEMGAGTECILEMYFPKESKLVTLYNVVFGGISSDYTSDDFASYSVPFTCSVDENDNVYSIEGIDD